MVFLCVDSCGIIRDANSSCQFRADFMSDWIDLGLSRRDVCASATTDCINLDCVILQSVEMLRKLEYFNVGDDSCGALVLNPIVSLKKLRSLSVNFHDNGLKSDGFATFLESLVQCFFNWKLWPICSLWQGFHGIPT